SATRGEVEVDAGQSSGQFVRRIWLEPQVSIHPAVSQAVTEFEAAIIGPGSFYTSLMPIFLVSGVPEALAEVKGPIILIANLLTEGRGMNGFTAADAVNRIEEAIRRKIDVVITNTTWPSPAVLGRYALEHKEPLALGSVPDHCELVGGEFWTGDIARHDRRRLGDAVGSVLARRVLQTGAPVGAGVGGSGLASSKPIFSSWSARSALAAVSLLEQPSYLPLCPLCG